MQLIITILWVQLVMGLAGLWLFFGHTHWAATANEWVMNRAEELQEFQSSSAYQETIDMDGLSSADLIDDLQADIRIRLEMAGYGLGGSLIFVVLSVVLLVRFHKLQGIWRNA